MLNIKRIVRNKHQFIIDTETLFGVRFVPGSTVNIGEKFSLWAIWYLLVVYFYFFTNPHFQFVVSSILWNDFETNNESLAKYFYFFL